MSRKDELLYGYSHYSKIGKGLRKRRPLPLSRMTINRPQEKRLIAEEVPDPGRIELFGRENPQFPCPERLVKSRPKKWRG